jgi:HNH endonuclease
MAVSERVRSEVLARADYRCEYCRSYSRLVGMPLVVEHILPKASGGEDNFDNLAASCYRCNEFKGTKTDAADPQTGQLTSLFNPRQQSWHEHFSWVNGGTHIAGLTPIARATVIALRLNNEYVTEARALWIESNWHPPTI